jgi:hypothetical protein
LSSRCSSTAWMGSDANPLMQTQFCCCPVCESFNRDFVCPNCVNSQQLKERDHQQLGECLAQAESLRAQRAELLKSLEEHLAARVGTPSTVNPIGLSKRKSCDLQHSQARIYMQQSLLQGTSIEQTCPWSCSAGSLPKAAGCSMEEGTGAESSASEG